jgi:tRNA(Ile)-lysidine synthetase-like protein
VRRIEEAASRDGPWSMRTSRCVTLAARSGVVALFTDGPPDSAGGAAVWDGSPCTLPIDGVRALRIEPLGAPGAPPPGAMTCHLPAGARVEARPRRSGDRFRLGPQGTKLVSDELCDRKIHPAWRTRVPLVFVDGELRWMPGVREIRPLENRPANACLTLEGPTPWAPAYRKATT